MDLREIPVNQSAATPRHPWELARVRFIRTLLARTGTLEAGAGVIDIGCGDAFVTQSLAVAFPGAMFYAVDTAMTDEQLEGFRRRLARSNVLLFQSLDKMTLSLDRPASCVLLMDVLEHIHDDAGFLEDLLQRSFVGDETRFLITVPAYESLFCSHDERLGHYRRYSNRSLRRRVEGAGLGIEEIGYFFFSLLPVRALQAMKERIVGAGSPERIARLAGWDASIMQASITQFLLLDASIGRLLRTIGINLPGLSNYAICRKSV
jgi:hypothetical protein